MITDDAHPHEPCSLWEGLITGLLGKWGNTGAVEHTGEAPNLDLVG